MTETTEQTVTPRTNHRTRVFALIAFMVLCLIIAALNKPFFNPPDWLFAPVWTVIYFMIAFSGWRVWLKTGIANAKGPFGLYAAQLALNLAWSFMFFGAQSPILGLIDVVNLLAVIIANMIAFWKIDRLAGMLLVPYALWVAFATLLNAAIWHLN